MKKKILISKKTKKKVVKKVEKKAEKKKLNNILISKLPMNIPTKAVVTVSKSTAQPIVPVKPIINPVKPIVAPVVKRRLLYVEVAPEKYFVLCDGRKIRSAKELADVLQLISDDMFKYHVTDSKNDFSNWINDIFGEPELAKKIRTVRNRIETSLEIYRYIFDKLPK